MPMWGVDASGQCLCGGVDPRTRKPCNAGKHSRDEESWKDGRSYSPGDFTDRDNVALALGPGMGNGPWLMCLDIDGPGSPPMIGQLLPPTLEQQSPRGRHLFFHVDPFAPLGNWVDAFQTKHVTGTGLDVRYARGRINVAPSRSAFGAYRWREWREPAALPRIAEQLILDERRRRGLPVESRWSRGSKRP